MHSKISNCSDQSDKGKMLASHINISAMNSIGLHQAGVLRNDERNDEEIKKCLEIPGGGLYSGFQVTGMIEEYFWLWNLQFWDFLGWGNLENIALGGLI